jgi:hypothetical protein
VSSTLVDLLRCVLMVPVVLWLGKLIQSRLRFDYVRVVGSRQSLILLQASQGPVSSTHRSQCVPYMLLQWITLTVLLVIQSKPATR